MMILAQAQQEMSTNDLIALGMVLLFCAFFIWVLFR